MKKKKKEEEEIYDHKIYVYLISLTIFYVKDMINMRKKLNNIFTKNQYFYSLYLGKLLFLSLTRIKKIIF